MADTRHVNANLMGASRLQPALHIRKLAEALQNPVMSHGFAAILLIDTHLFSVHRMAADGPAYGPLVVPHHAMDNGVVFPRNGVHLQLLRNGVVRHIVLTDDENTGRVHVDAVNDSRSHHAVDTG